MNQDRAKAAEAALKNVETLKKSLTKSNSVKAKTVIAPSGPTKIQASGLPEPVAGTGFVQYIMYFLGGILVLGIVLMVVDKWFFPIFKRKPGAAGYISLPGSDTSEYFWTDLKSITNITIGGPPPDSSTTPAPNPEPLYSSALASQSTYSITLDVLINDEKPQNLGSNAATDNILRTFFFLGTALDNNNRKVTFTMDNTMNRVHVNVYNSRHEPKSCVIDNVPVHTPFRIGLVKTSFTMEAYLNGLLVQTVQLQGQQIDPAEGDTIYAPQNIKTTGDYSSVDRLLAAYNAAIARNAISLLKSADERAAAAAELASTKSAWEAGAAAAASKTAVLSTGIQVMNLRLFPYAVQPNEMQARMSDLTQIVIFNPKNTPTSTLNSISSWWNSLWT
jgi:hypothetical protein